MTAGELDRLLDEGLASYSAMEPRAGLSGRVLARVHASPNRRAWLGWLLAAAAAAVVATSVVFWPAPDAPAPPPLVVWNVPAPEIHRTPKIRRAVNSRSHVNTPLTVSGPTLLALVRKSPELAAQLTKRQDQPLEIQPLRIEALEIEEVVQ